MEKDQAVREIARGHLELETLETRNSDAADIHEMAVWSIKAALEAAYEAGRASASQDDADTAGEGSGHWTQMTVDDATEHLKTWIDGLDDPSQIATLMLHVCGCPRAAVIDGTHIAAELP